ncbi:dynein axonemal assembly factor 6 [Harmonia axyridis]|uniref:dynein axonemal assembly factor 6 n=1 Tax=Harmonia axyridis TaxID=115357 RepID=UPI001E278F5B|nr:dynein axonemal assembly factor 6 [Harmonia axyridis]
MDTTRDEIEGLMKLFNAEPRRRYADSEDEELEDISEVNSNTNVEDRSEEKKNPYTKIEAEEEQRMKYEELAAENEFFLDEAKPNTDWKKTPKWQFSYRQKVTSSDVFLQMGPKNPSTACCEDMIIEVYLPKDKRQNIDLKVKNNQLQIFSPNHVLDIPLPHPVDPQKGNAQWDQEQEKLTITLNMQREFDYMNF